MADEKLHALLSGHTRGVLVTLKSDGRPQLSNIAYRYADGVVHISITDDRAKYRNLRRDPRASLHVTTDDFWHWVVGEGTSELLPVAAAPDDPTVDALVEYYRAVSGEHPDWDDYRAAMVRDHRLVVKLPIDRVYGQP